MPSYSSPSPPIIARPIDDPRPPPPAQAPLSSPPSAHKTNSTPVPIKPNPTPVPTKPTPIVKVDNGPPPGGKQPGTGKQDDSIDMEVFEQILELDDDDDDFSRGMVDEYFSQAERTFTDMDDALKKRDLKRLSSLGHFLKGSSAALGVCKVQASCEDIQHYGQLQERDSDEAIKEDYAITKIGTTLARAREEYETAKCSLQRFYRERDEEGLT